MPNKTVGDVLHSLVHNAPWSEADKTDAIEAVTAEFGHPTPRPTVTQLVTMQEENKALQAQITELQDAMRKAGLIQTAPAAQSANTLSALVEKNRLEAENASLRAQLTDQAAADATKKAAEVAAASAAAGGAPT
jgi:regulator of replication initiation timing